jgi:3-isopropylmalate/(R)-2-methylmalate dehydratase large subunit
MHMGKTLYDKLWDSHVVHVEDDGTAILYVDFHLINEVSSPQAFEGLRMEGRSVWRPTANLAAADHNVPTCNRQIGILDPVANLQVMALNANCETHGIIQYRMDDIRQGIVHVVGPEQGATMPGMTIVCGDSHTSTHGAFGALAHGIGTSELEHVLATQTLLQKKSKNMLVLFEGELPRGCTAKDMILTVIRKIGTAGGNGYAIEYGGNMVRSLSLEGRMTLCNMTIEAGARAGMVAVDDKTINYLRGRPFCPTGDLWDRAVEVWKDFRSDEGAEFDRIVVVDADEIAPQVTWGTSPEMVIGIDQRIPDPRDEADPVKKDAFVRALHYMGLEAGTPVLGIQLDKVFIGSCTNSRIEDLRSAAEIVQQIGGRIASNIRLALVVPGSGLVKVQAEREGLDKIFTAAGFEWRDAGCSMCVAMNEDRLNRGERCASTSNRNFEGRQGAGGRTHLMSPAMAAASAMAGHICDIRNLDTSSERFCGIDR